MDFVWERTVDRTCQFCGRSFPFDARHPKQATCSEKECRNAFKKEWRRKKLATDDDYKAAKRDAQRRWMDSHADYWRAYRDSHPDYTERNRIQPPVDLARLSEFIDTLESIFYRLVRIPTPDRR